MNTQNQEEEKKMRGMFLELDTSKDGKISKEEFMKGM